MKVPFPRKRHRLKEVYIFFSIEFIHTRTVESWSRLIAPFSGSRIFVREPLSKFENFHISDYYVAKPLTKIRIPSFTESQHIRVSTDKFISKFQTSHSRKARDAWLKISISIGIGSDNTLSFSHSSRNTTARCRSERTIKRDLGIRMLGLFCGLSIYAPVVRNCHTHSRRFVDIRESRFYDAPLLA